METGIKSADPQWKFVTVFRAQGRAPFRVFDLLWEAREELPSYLLFSYQLKCHFTRVGKAEYTKVLNRRPQDIQEDVNDFAGRRGERGAEHLRRGLWLCVERV